MAKHHLDAAQESATANALNAEQFKALVTMKQAVWSDKGSTDVAPPYQLNKWETAVDTSPPGWKQHESEAPKEGDVITFHTSSTATNVTIPDGHPAVALTGPPGSNQPAWDIYVNGVVVPMASLGNNLVIEDNVFYGGISIEQASQLMQHLSQEAVVLAEHMKKVQADYGSYLASSSYEMAARSLYARLPNLDAIIEDCPAEDEDLPGYYGAHCGKPEDRRSLFNLIVHLNDRHQWSRERIADWLETLDLDLTFPTPKEDHHA